MKPLWQPGANIRQPDWRVELDGQLAWLRQDKSGALKRIALGKATRIHARELQISLRNAPEFAEIQIENGKWKIVSKSPDAVGVALR